MTLPFLPNPRQQFFGNDGNPLAGGKLYTYAAGTSTPKATYTDTAGTIANTNPIVLNARGEATIYWDGAYKVTLTDAASATIYTQDNVTSYDLGLYATTSSLAASSGSSLIGFLQSGTGATARTAQAKMRDEVTVKDFGAVGDGATNDTAAFTAAIKSGREVFVPAGSYNVTPMVFSGFLSSKLRGAGRDSTKIYLTTAGTAMTFSNCQWQQISDMSFYTTGVAQSLAGSNGIQFDTGSGNCVIERCNFYGFAVNGLSLIGTAIAPLSGSNVRDCYFLGNGGKQLYMYQNNDWWVTGCQFGSLSSYIATHGSYLDTSSEGTYSSNYHWSNTRGHYQNACQDVAYLGNRFEINYQEGVVFNGGVDIVFNGNRVFSNSQTATGAYDNMIVTATDGLIFTSNMIRTWDATTSAVGVNFTGACNQLSIGKNIVRGFKTTLGPMALGGACTNFNADYLVTGVSTAVATNTTIFMSSGGQTLQVAAYNPIPKRMILLQVIATVDTAPGASQSFTYTVQKNGTDTAMTGSISGSSFSGVLFGPTQQILFAQNDTFILKLVTSNGSAVAAHRFMAFFAEY